MTNRMRNAIISFSVVGWLLVLHYESARHFYLNALFKRELPKVKFLFPPAGWIMFFNVDEQFAYAEVYGVKNNQPQLIDPHLIFRTRTIGFDNIHRNVLSTVLSPEEEKPFCRYLRWRFADFDRFLVMVVVYPSVVKTPMRRIQRVEYECRRSDSSLTR